MSDRQDELAVLFADLGGSTRLYDTRGDVAARRIVAECVERIAAAAETRGGRVIKTIGDEVMCSFASADAAVDAALDMLASAGGDGGDGLAVHVGVHFGAVLHEKDDLFGDTVNVAARMVGLARDGEVLATGAFVARLSPERQSLARRLERRALKGKEEKIEIFGVVAPSDGKLTALRFDVVADEPETASARLVLRRDGRTLVLDASRPRATIGRQPGVDWLLDDVGVSRLHATVELRHGKFHLCDSSTNGTVLIVDGQPALRLRREEALLLGSGRFGVPRGPGDPEPAAAIHFCVERAAH